MNDIYSVYIFSWYSFLTFLTPYFVVYHGNKNFSYPFRFLIYLDYSIRILFYVIFLTKFLNVGSGHSHYAF